MLKKLKESSRCLDTLLLIATYFHANKYEKIVEFVQKTSQLQSISKLNNLELLDFVKELIPLSYLAREILKSNSKDDYVLLCVFQL
jgi:dsDNA-specific endonuclease/ATPase MutS2